MKYLIELHRALQDETFMKVQFLSNSRTKNVLFLPVKTTGKNLYRYLLPYFVMREQELPEKTGYSTWECAILGIEKFSSERPFVTNTRAVLNSNMILWADTIVVPFTTQPLKEIYQQWRMINPQIQIFYNIDFDYTSLPKDHIYKDAFDIPEIIKAVNENIILSDATFTINAKLAEHLADYINKILNTDEYASLNPRCRIQPFPMFIDPSIVLENIDNNPIPEQKKEGTRIGIVCSEHFHSDLMAYKNEMAKLSVDNNVTWVLFGYDGIKDGKKFYTSETKIEYVKPCSIVHYFKQLKALHLDAMFIPLRRIEYNERTEGYNRLMEAWLLNIPVITPNIFPYNEIIVNERTGFFFDKKKQLIDTVEFIQKNPDAIKKLTSEASKVLEHTFTFNEPNVIYLNEIFK
jgi:hypothetical protein